MASLPAPRGKSAAELIVEADEISARANVALCRFQQSMIEMAKLFPADPTCVENAEKARRELVVLTTLRQPRQLNCGG